MSYSCACVCWCVHIKRMQPADKSTPYILSKGPAWQAEKPPRVPGILVVLGLWDPQANP
jgi:hypothetical protein